MLSRIQHIIGWPRTRISGLGRLYPSSLNLLPTPPGGIKLGALSVDAMFLGANPVDALYLGAQLIFPTGPPPVTEILIADYTHGDSIAEWAGRSGRTTEDVVWFAPYDSNHVRSYRASSGTTIYITHGFPGINGRTYRFDVESPAIFGTQQERMCVVGVGRPWLRTTFPVATPTEAWRMDIGLAYCGNPLNPIGVTLISFHQRSNIRQLLTR